VPFVERRSDKGGVRSFFFICLTRFVVDSALECVSPAYSFFQAGLQSPGEACLTSLALAGQARIVSDD
jgi:hypothetical protein